MPSSLGGGCGDSFTEAVDPAGTPWLFSSTCVPRDWNTHDAPRDLMEMPRCSGGSSDEVGSLASQPRDAGADALSDAAATAPCGEPSAY